MASFIPIILLVVPLTEIAVFVLVGGQIGLIATLTMIFVTAVIGSILLRVQGFGLLRRIQQMTEQGQVPGRELVHGVMILIAGVLLLTPGFVTDTLGFLLFVPAVRDFGWNLIKSRISIVSTMAPGQGHPRASNHQRHEGDAGRSRPGGTVIDLDDNEYSHNPDPNSPWRGDNDR